MAPGNVTQTGRQCQRFGYSPTNGIERQISPGVDLESGSRPVTSSTFCTRRPHAITSRGDALLADEVLAVLGEVTREDGQRGARLNR